MTGPYCDGPCASPARCAETGCRRITDAALRRLDAIRCETGAEPRAAELNTNQNAERMQSWTR